MSITEKILQIRGIRAHRNKLSQLEYETTRPLRTDCSDIPRLYGRFSEIADPTYKDNKRIFVFIIVYMYSPISMINRGICRNGVRMEIAKVLGISKPAVTQYFGDAKSLFLNHTGFRNEVERVFQLISDK